MSAPPFMQLYVADYLGDTRHLTTEQHGAYLLLLMAMWRAGGELSSDPAKLGRIVGLTPVRWRKIADDVLEFFKADGERLTHGRVTAELQKAQRTSDARSEAGQRGAQAKALKTIEPVQAIAVALPEPGLGPAQALQISEPEEVSGAKAPLSPAGDAKGKYPEDFEAIWKAYPHIKGRSSKPKAFGQWRRIPAETRKRLLAAVQRYATNGREPKGDCGAPAMQRWLLEERYADWQDDATAAAIRSIQPFPDTEIRNAVISAKGEAWAGSWLDPCSWEPERRVIVPRTSLAASKLRSEVIRVLEARRATIQSPPAH